MKKTLFFAIAFGMSVALFAQSRVEVTIKNIKEAKGTMRVAIFKDSETFLKKPLLGQVVKAEKGEIKVIFDNVPQGVYALSIIHDENENEKLDSNFFGVPTEGFGFSNDAMGMFGPPAFDKASFTMTSEAKTLAVTLRYM